MTLYSDFAARRTRQVIADCLALAGIAGFVVLGIVVHSTIAALQAIGVQLADAGSSFESTMSEIGDRLGRIPLIGGGIGAPFDEASDAGTTLQEFGRAQQDAIAQLAVGAGLIVAVVPILAILVLWLIPRLRFVRRAAWARRASATAAGLDLLACRALLSRRPPEILAAHPDAAGGWRRGERDAVEALALLELRACGVRPSRTAVLPKRHGALA
jgi:hypothetical protein